MAIGPHEAAEWAEAEVDELLVRLQDTEGELRRERDRLRTAIEEALGHLDRHPPMHMEQCAPCRVRRILTDALEGGGQ